MQGHISRVGHSVTGMRMRNVGLLAMILVLCVPSARAAEPVKINSLVTYPEMYKMKVVQVEGTVNNYRMNHFIGERTKLEKCVQDFAVDDGTGMIQASYAAICQMGPVMLKDGDEVTIEGHFLGNLDVRSVKKR